MNETIISGSPISEEGRTNTTFIESVKFNDVEEVLAGRFGDKFRQYRTEYRKSLNYDTNGFLPDFPITVSVELVNRCNLSCIMCYTVNHSDPKSTLDLDSINEMMMECKRHDLPAMVVGMGAEPLLYKDVRNVLKLARDAGVMDVFLGTNGVLLNERMSLFLVDMEIARVEISLDAATPETYHQIRGKNQLELIERNIHNLLEIRGRSNAKLPVVRLCFCVQDLNRHECEQFVEKWNGLVDYIDFQKYIDFSFVDELRSTGTVEQIDSFIVEDTHCAYPFNSLHVWSNGNVTPCCTFFAKNDDLVVGNIHEEKLKDIWMGERIRKIRRQLQTGDLNPTCRVCLSRRDHQGFDEAMRKNSTEDHPKS